MTLVRNYEYFMFHIINVDNSGFGDVPWNNPEVIAPSLDFLAKTGLILNQFYAQPRCSPSRSALLTGYYPIKTGIQNGIVSPQEPTGLPTNFTLFPEHLRTLGYATHLVGKWHLGYCSRDYLPINRGFDTFYGMYLGSQGYFSHSRVSTGVYNF